MKFIVKTCALLFISAQLFAQIPPNFQWLPNGTGYRDVVQGEIVQVTLPGQQQQVIVSKAELTPGGMGASLQVISYAVSEVGDKFLIYTNSKRVWRYDTRGDYWVLDKTSKTLKQIGVGLPASSLMFAKFSPDGKKVAYVSNHNIYAEDIQSGEMVQLTHDGTDRIINGTFDWAYEEEFSCLDGFRWSPDGKALAYWQLDARKIRNFLMINNTDSIYSHTIPVEYPKVGETPSPYKIGIVSANGGNTKWMDIPGDPQNTYLPRMEWSGANELVAQQLNRKQNHSTLFYINTFNGEAMPFYTESDEAWIDIKSRLEDTPVGWDWINNGKEFVWISEKDGWMHAYRVSRDGKKETLITVGNYDIISPVRIDEKNNTYYFMASPDNATQSYLYKTTLDGKGKTIRVSPVELTGTHSYDMAPTGKYARHRFSNAKTAPLTEWISIPTHKAIDATQSIASWSNKIDAGGKNIEFFKVTTSEGVEVDGWIVKPDNFDPSKKYPILFMVYGEAGGSTVRDVYGTGYNKLYAPGLAEDGYLFASMDNRGTPSPKGRAWRRAIYRKVGRINIQDMAGAATAMFEKYSFIDTSRVAVYGWSGGGSSTLNLLFQYPKIFKTGIAVAAVANQLTYDNIYQERYMGIPQETREDFIQGSPITHAKNLEGNLLYIHGTGDDNVHYQNAEMLLNELIKHNKVFQFMSYPNRSHSISEGEGTSRHLSTLFTDFLQKNCPPGGR